MTNEDTPTRKTQPESMSMMDAPWFYGQMTRREASEMMVGKPNGSFLLRHCNSYQGDYALTVVINDRIRHYQIASGRYGHPYTLILHNDRIACTSLEQIVVHFRWLMVSPCGLLTRQRRHHARKSVNLSQ
ncbi:phosphoinositide-3-kinase, regulatory subunit 3a (gamma) [Planoprotostelium fungivorum]|uniref:Phosphoinositide-3-kinase, regulatory subunit 3a (Gamma) n=1 Tax=Planoprotostelium fungivorum TaxID=1890364 RepID=A0A2P6NAQ0_9EUKA|nr:phosphoinositide-3-kinase, regulatory subunit 3a (gamma) [Planoprotostelium fungivorum]